MKDADGNWVDSYSGGRLYHTNWEVSNSKDYHFTAMKANGHWVSVPKSEAHWFICESRNGNINQFHPGCDRVVDGNHPGDNLACSTVIDLPTLYHNSGLYVRIITETGGYKEIKSGTGTHMVPFTPAFFVRELSYLVDRNEPVHCSFVGLCPNKKLWNNFNSIITTGSFLMDITGWVTFDWRDSLTRYSMKIFSLVPGPEKTHLVKDRVVFSRTFTSETKFHHSIRPGYFIVELHVSDAHGNTRVSRKLILYIQNPRISADVRNPIKVSGSFKNSWITKPDTEARISYDNHFFLSDFRYFSERYEISLPLKMDADIHSDYEHKSIGDFDVSLKGLPNIEGVVKLEYQWTGPSTTEPYSWYWTTVKDLASSFTERSFRQSTLWLRATDVFGNTKVVRHNIYVATTSPSIHNLKLTSTEEDYKSEDLSSACLSLQATDEESGIMAMQTSVSLRDQLIGFKAFPTKYCQGNSESYCQCNQAGVCTSKPYTLCFTEMNLPKGEHGSSYVVTVTTVNFANLTSTKTLGFTVDTTAPLGGIITKYRRDADKDFTNSDEVRIYWSAIYEPETDISRYVVMKTENIDSEISADLILEHGEVTTEASRKFTGLRPSRPTRFCGIAYNTAGLPSQPVCSTPVVYDITPPELVHLTLLNSFTQPGLAFDGIDFWFVEHNGTKSRVVDDCSHRRLSKTELNHYPPNYRSYSGSGFCNYAEFEGTTLLLSPSVFHITSRFADDESGVRKIKVTVTLTKGGSFYDQVMNTHEYVGSEEQIIIYHNNDITWYTPRFYVNVIAYNKVGLQSTYAFGPCYFYDEKDTYRGKRRATLNSSGLWMNFDLDKIDSGFDYRDPLKTLELKLVTKKGETVVDYTEAVTTSSWAFLPISAVKEHVVPNQELEMVCLVRITTAINKTIMYESENSIVFSYKSAGNSMGYIIDGEGDVDVDYQTSNTISASWDGIDSSLYSCAAGISKNGDHDNLVWRYEKVQVPGKLNVTLSNLETNQRYFVELKCRNKKASDDILLSSDGVVIDGSKPFLKRLILESQFGFDMNYIKETWSHTKLFSNIPQMLSYSVQRNGHKYIPWKNTDTSTTFTSTSLLPQNSNLTLHLKLTEFNDTAETSSPEFVVDITPPYVSTQYLPSDLKLHSGSKIYNDGSCIKVRIYARDGDSSISMKWVSQESKSKNHISQHLYTSPNHILVCSHFDHNEMLELVSHSRNGAGLQESRSCGHLIINSRDPHPPSYKVRDRSSLILGTFDGDDKIEAKVGTRPYLDDIIYLTDAKSVHITNLTGYISSRSIGKMGLTSSWTTRKFKNGNLVPLSCEDMELCGKIKKNCSHNINCPLRSRITSDVSIHNIYDKRYLHSTSMVAFSWATDESADFTEVTIIDSEFYKEEKEWKVVGKDTSVTLTVELRENIHYRAVVAYHYSNKATTVLSSHDFVPATTAPKVIHTNPVVITAVEQSSYATRYVGRQARISWKGSCDGAESFDVAVGSCHGCDNLQTWSRLVNTTTTMFNIANLKQGTHLYAAIICYNKAGLGSKTTTSSPVYVDLAPPIPSKVIYHWTPDGIHIMWPGFYDIDTDVSNYVIKLVDTNETLVAETATFDKTYCDFRLNQLKPTFSIEVTAFDALNNNITVNTDKINVPGNVSVASLGCLEWPEEIHLIPNSLIHTKCLSVYTTDVENYTGSLLTTIEFKAPDIEYLKVILKDFNKNVKQEDITNRKLGNYTFSFRVDNFDIMSIELFGLQQKYDVLNTEFTFKTSD